jgi:hypothetical protein
MAKRILVALLVAVCMLTLLAGCGKQAVEKTNESHDGEQVSAPPPQNDTRIASAQIGDEISFGGYEWLVLDKQGGKILVITKDIIALRGYSDEYNNGATWAECSLREWLNGVFYNDFSLGQQRKIAETEIYTPPNPWFGTDGGDNSTDKIFLLSIQEVVAYFGDSGALSNWDENEWWLSDNYNDKRQAKLNLNETQFDVVVYDIDNSPTYGKEYSREDAKKYAGEFNDEFWWWRLRTPGGNKDLVARVFNDGTIQVHGFYLSNDYVDVDVYTDNINTVLGGVRPAMWITIES